MRAGISRVVVEIIILVIAVALALLIFSPISGYIFGSLGRTATVGGASQIQILSANTTAATANQPWTIYAKNLGPGTLTYTKTDDFRVYIDGKTCSITKVADSTTVTPESPSSTPISWDKDKTIKVDCSLTTGVETTKQHNIVLYGPGGTQAQYLYYPPPT